MLTKSVLDNLILSIRSQWEPGGGVMVVLFDEKDSTPLRLTVDCILNQGLTAEKCRVWQGNSILYSGSLTTEAVRPVTRGFRVVKAELFCMGPRAKTFKPVATFTYDKRTAVPGASKGLRRGSDCE